MVKSVLCKLVLGKFNNNKQSLFVFVLFCFFTKVNQHQNKFWEHINPDFRLDGCQRCIPLGHLVPISCTPKGEKGPTPSSAWRHHLPLVSPNRFVVCCHDRHRSPFSHSSDWSIRTEFDVPRLSRDVAKVLLEFCQLTLQLTTVAPPTGG